MNAGKHLRQLRDEGRKIVGCFPLYPPVELFYAMDLVPVVLWGLTNAHKDTAGSDRAYKAGRPKLINLNQCISFIPGNLGTSLNRLAYGHI